MGGDTQAVAFRHSGIPIDRQLSANGYRIRCGHEPTLLGRHPVHAPAVMQSIKRSATKLRGRATAIGDRRDSLLAATVRPNPKGGTGCFCFPIALECRVGLRRGQGEEAQLTHNLQALQVASGA